MSLLRVTVSFLSFLAIVFIGFTGAHDARNAALEEKHLLYVASPGIRNYVEFGGVGILVYDIEQGHKFVALSDETGRQVHSEKLLEIVWANGKPVRASDQFGLGRKRGK